jgi:hypothetical protein
MSATAQSYLKSNSMLLIVWAKISTLVLLRIASLLAGLLLKYVTPY